MSCGTTLTASRKRGGYVKPKGIKAVSFAAWDSANLIVNTPTGVTALPTTMVTPPAIYRFEVKNTADLFTETAAKDLATMTGDKTGAGTFALMYCDRIPTLKDVQALLDGTWNVFFEHNDGTITVAGSGRGADITQVVESTDAMGFVCTLATLETNFAYTLAATGVQDYNDGIVTAA